VLYEIVRTVGSSVLREAIVAVTWEKSSKTFRIRV
jgi:hypothetical protein